MGSQTVRCPGCGAGMDIGVSRADRSREYVCEQCYSVVAAAPVFRRLLGDHRFSAVWTAPVTPGTGPACCFCGLKMETRGLEVGRAAVCHTCQVLWFDREALEALPAAQSSPAFAAAAMVKCPCCGAPVSSPLDDCCRYCGTVLEALEASPSAT